MSSILDYKLCILFHSNTFHQHTHHMKLKLYMKYTQLGKLPCYIFHQGILHNQQDKTCICYSQISILFGIANKFQSCKKYIQHHNSNHQLNGRELHNQCMIQSTHNLNICYCIECKPHPWSNILKHKYHNNLSLST